MSKKNHVMYSESIRNSIDALCKEIVKYYPNILDIKYNEHSCNDWDDDRSIFRQRMEMGLYIELIKAEVIK